MRKDAFFKKMDRIGLALAYADVRLKTGHSEVDPGKINHFLSKFSRNVPVNLPIIGSPMDTVTEYKMAIALALEGGLGIIHRSLSPKDQGNNVARVKFHLNGLIKKPITVQVDDTIGSILARIEERDFNFRSFPVLDKSGRLVGLLTGNDFEFCLDRKLKAEDIMSRDLKTAGERTKTREAFNIMVKNKKKILPLVNSEKQIVGMYVFTDVKRIITGGSPLYNVDANGNLRVGAAVGTGDDALERAELLVKKNVDVLVIDTAHGDSKNVFETLKMIKKNFPGVDVVVGNVSQPESAKRLANTGADGIKVGQGPGSICTTRIVAGVGRPQLTAVYECAKVLRGSDIPICADGGIKETGDIPIAIGAGAHTVMLGNMLAGTKEAPGEIIMYKGVPVKVYRGMGSLEAMQASRESRNRYRQIEAKADKLIPEGVKGYVPYKGEVAEIIFQCRGGLADGMGYVGVSGIAELQLTADFDRISHAGLAESHPHSLLEMEDTTNYKKGVEMKPYDKLLKNVKTLAIVCYQWGDTGKGKFVDLFADWADIIARGTGGANAGHTIVLNGKEYIFHLIPSGILRDGDRKINIIGNGVAFDPRIVREELAILKKEKKSFRHLMIAHNAKLVLPQHIVLDRVKENCLKSGKLGTTGRGIGPVYTDHYARAGLVVNDMLNPDIFRERLVKNLQEKIRLLKTHDPELVKEVMRHEHLENGSYYDPKNIFAVDAIVEQYREYGKLFRNYIADTDYYLRQQLGYKKILLEGAQGLLLSVDKGSYPYVTSSDSSVQGLARGVGLKDGDIDLTLGIVKAFYMTRVGAGPFPTEIGGRASEEWCGRNFVTRESEKSQIQGADMNSKDEFSQGVGIRIAGGEYGATTGRPRRTGWLDLALMHYAIWDSGPNVVLTKLDVLSQCREIKICTHYIYQGPKYQLGKILIKKGSRIDVAMMQSEVLRHCEPVYTVFPGIMENLYGASAQDSLPRKLNNILDFITEMTGARLRILSFSPEREGTIFLK